MPGKGKTTTYTFWLIPENPEFDKFKAIILDNQRHVGEPVFIPHITLLSGIPVGLKFKSLAQKVCRIIPGFSLQCRQVEKDGDYFHCLYVPVEISYELKRLRRLVEKLYSVSTPRPFKPHVSLMYHDPRADEVDAIVNTLPDFCSWQITISRLELWDTSGPVDKWKSLSGFNLAL